MVQVMYKHLFVFVNQNEGWYCDNGNGKKTNNGPLQTSTLENPWINVK